MKQKNIINPEDSKKLKRYLKEKKRLIVLAHANPDGDTLGSAVSLYLGLKSIGQNIKIACIDKISQKYKFLNECENILTNFDENNFDAVIFVDCGNKKMTKFHEKKPKIHSDKMVKINIDHHPSNDYFGEINFISTNSASTTEIIFHLLKDLKINITPKIATALLLGIYTDTGSFMHQNTKPESYKIASELVKLGANISQIARNVFQNYELKTLKLWGKALQNLNVSADGAAIVGIEKKDYESIGASRSDLEGVIDYINSMPEARYSVLLSEDETGNVKASLRTRKKDVDVKALAEQFGGGGHVKASGFTIKGGKLEKEVKWKIVQE